MSQNPLSYCILQIVRDPLMQVVYNSWLLCRPAARSLIIYGLAFWMLAASLSLAYGRKAMECN